MSLTLRRRKTYEDGDYVSLTLRRRNARLYVRRQGGRLRVGVLPVYQVSLLTGLVSLSF